MAINMFRVFVYKEIKNTFLLFKIKRYYLIERDE